MLRLITLVALKGGGPYSMSEYSCKCPAPGCDLVFKVRANNRKDAFEKLFPIGKQHVIDSHPDFPEPDDVEERAKEYVMREMKQL